MMLSRIADSLFWIARYMERAEHTARLLDVNYHMLLEESQQSYNLRWDAIITISAAQDSFYKIYSDANPRNVFEFLGFHEGNPNSVATCIHRVRENARTIRAWFLSGLNMATVPTTVDVAGSPSDARACARVSGVAGTKRSRSMPLGI